MFKKIVGNLIFSDPSMNLETLRQTKCLDFNPIMVESCSAPFIVVISFGDVSLYVCPLYF